MMAPSVLPGLAAPDEIQRAARFSNCGQFRWTLTRKWREGGRSVCWIMLNPSTADGLKDDPTIRRCIEFSRAWGYDELVVVNLFPFRATDPRECQRWADWERNGPDWYARDAIVLVNLPLVVQAAKAASLVVAAWGCAPWAADIAAYVVEEITTGPEPWPSIYCLGRTADGSPKHPLARGGSRVPNDARPTLFEAVGDGQTRETDEDPDACTQDNLACFICQSLCRQGDPDCCQRPEPEQGDWSTPESHNGEDDE